jgi:amino acid adenylation domain-containing protein
VSGGPPPKSQAEQIMDTVSERPSGEQAGPPHTLVELLGHRARQRPERRAYTFLSDGETEAASLSYGELERRARAIGARLQAAGAAGERVLLLYPPGLEYIAALFGCLYAGAVAVPAYPPRRPKSLPRLQATVANSRPSVALATSATLSAARRLADAGTDFEGMLWLNTDEIDDVEGRGWVETRPSGDGLALIQYTSGSTAAPRGVMLSHGNLLHNQGLLRAAFENTEETVIVGWLPLYHDMGLIGNVFHALYLGSECVLMSPLHFLQQPVRWLQAVTSYRASVSGGPNFAYDLCARKVTPEQKATLDLSGWRTAFNGAEPVRAETMERFAAAFASCGFRREAFFPCYGLAEATLFVSGGPVAAPPSVRLFSGGELERKRVVDARPEDVDVRALVGCGQTRHEQRVFIVEPETRTVCPPDRVGEIWVSGPSVARGYWGRPAETEETFGARLSGTGEGPFLRTGDLGFMRGGQLFIAGRLKDLIIIRGRNHYPQDIELTVEQSHPSLRPNAGAAFSVEADGEERLVVVHELTPERRLDVDEVARAVRQAIAERHELQAYSVVLIRAGSLPKTSSGKVQRRACRALYLSGELKVSGESRQAVADVPAADEELPATPEDVREWLASKVAALVGARPAEIALNQPLVSYGLDSISAVQLRHEIEAGLGVSIPLTDFFSGASVAQLAAEVGERLGEHSRPDRNQSPGTEGAERDGLSYGQKALWFLHRLRPEDAAYHIARAARINGELDEDALHRAFQVLTRRHAALRTTFEDGPRGLRREVHERAEVCFEREDAERLSASAFHERLADEARRPFDLERGPVLRARLFRRAPREHVLLLVVHHIVADLWSLTLLFEQLWRLYAADIKGESAAPLPQAADFSEFVNWQERLLAGTTGERLKEYWCGRLGGELPITRLPAAPAAVSSSAPRAASHELHIEPALTEALSQLARRHGTTLYVTLVSAFVALLHRYTGQTDLVLGSIASGRSHADCAQTVGFFANPVALRAGVSGDEGFVSLLGQMSRTVQDALERQDYPFALLVEQLQPDRGTAPSPLFQILFNFQSARRPGRRWPTPFLLGRDGGKVEVDGLVLESVGVEPGGVQFELSLTMAEDEAGLAGSFEFDAALFGRPMIERLAGHLEVLLRAVAAEPERRLRELPLLATAEARQLEAWNSTAKAYPAGRRLHDLFTAQAQRTPDSTALVAGQHALSYGDLNAQANRTAHYLRSLGVKSETLVGVFLDRSVEMVVALLGILKAGGAYLPLDKNYPKERLSLMIEDAGLSYVLTTEACRASLPSAVARVVCLDAEREAVARQSADEPAAETAETNLAYAIYTSGSTGRPNGTAIEHRSAVAFLHWAVDAFTRDELASVLASTSICFDLSVFEIFAPLCTGGRVVLVENAMQLAELDPSTDITLINSVPSALEHLLRVRALPPSVRVVNLAGEPLPRKLADAIYANEGVEKLYNLYGPSEDTTYSTYALIERRGEGTPPIGKPISNTQVFLLDAGLNPVPVGVHGELYLGGAGLARGYLGQPRLTAAKFVPDPFSAVAGARLYRTGDLARLDENGEIEFLGRVDQQVKLRGYRIEPGEVEVALSAYRGVAEAAVTVKKDRGGEPCLSAYLVPEEKGSFETAAVLAYLREKLPPYLVPSFITTLDRLPRTPNGKLDRGALPAPESRVTATASRVAPRTEAERAVAAAWEQVLQRDGLSVEENFFEAGGSSLKMLDVLRLLEEHFGRRISINVLFKYPTISSLAGFITDGEEPGKVVEAIQRRAEAQKLALGRQGRPRRVPP